MAATFPPGYRPPVVDDRGMVYRSTTGTAPPVDVVDYASQVRFLFPWLPDELVSIFAAKWDETGDSNLALAALQQDPRYDQYFPGNRRPDGTLRLSEADYATTVDGYRRLIADYGLNPDVFADRFAGLIEGDVSPRELAGRLGAAYEQIVTNVPEVRQEFSRLYGVEGGEQALFASFIDPDVGEAILNRRIGVAQVAAEGVRRGFSLQRDFAESIVAEGVDQEAARQFFTQAENLLPTLDTLAKRHLDPDDDFDLTELAQAGIFGRSDQSRRIRRLFNAEAAAFSRQSPIAGDDGALTGLTLR